MIKVDNNPLVSVIIPAYNVRPFIKECLDSVFDQKYDNIEVIVVDDGSTDGTESILNDYSKHHTNLIVIHQSNSGQSVARNNGIKTCNGNYVVFVDSDDWLPSPDIIGKMVTKIQSENCDYIQGGLCFINNNHITKRYLPGERGVISEPLIISAAINVDGLYTGPFAKIYKTEFIKSNSLYFMEGLVNEDTGHSILISAYATRVGFINEIVYCSRERDGSTSRSDFKRMISTMHKVLDQTREDLKKLQKYESVSGIYESRYLRSLLYNLLQSAQRSSYKDFLDDWRFCMSSTEYTFKSPFARFLPIKHRLAYSLSRHPKLFYSILKTLNKYGFQMH